MLSLLAVTRYSHIVHQTDSGSQVLNILCLAKQNNTFASHQRSPAKSKAVDTETVWGFHRIMAEGFPHLTHRQSNHYKILWAILLLPDTFRIVLLRHVTLHHKNTDVAQQPAPHRPRTCSMQSDWSVPGNSCHAQLKSKRHISSQWYIDSRAASRLLSSRRKGQQNPHTSHVHKRPQEKTQ